MHIIVPIKQVPETGNVKMDPETGTMIRTGVETVINPLDLYALETAFRLKEEHGGTVTVITMGPAQAEKALREALAMGGDKAFLISDRAFAGSDTWATSYVLSRAIMEISRMAPDSTAPGHDKTDQGDADTPAAGPDSPGTTASAPYDLIIAGERATDGDTGQVGPGIAAWLDIPAVTYAAEVTYTQEGRLRVSRMIEEGYQIVSVPTPALVTVVKEIGSVRLPTLKGKIRSRKADIPHLTAEDLSAHEPLWGLAHSPTRVVRIEQTTVKREGTMIVIDEHTSPDTAADAVLTYLNEQNLILEDPHA